MSHFLGKHDLEEKPEGEKTKKQRRERRKEPSKSKEATLEERCRLMLEEWNKDIADPDAYMAELEAFIIKKYDENGLDDPANLAKYMSLPILKGNIPIREKK